MYESKANKSKLSWKSIRKMGLSLCVYRVHNKMKMVTNFLTIAEHRNSQTRRYTKLSYLIQRGRDRTSALLQTIYSKWFSGIYYIWVHIYIYIVSGFKFYCNVLPKLKLKIIHHWFRSWLGTDQALGHYLYQLWLCKLTQHIRHTATMSFKDTSHWENVQCTG